MTAQGKKVCAEDPRGPPCWLLSSRISSGMEACGSREWALCLTVGIRLCAPRIFTSTTGVRRDCDPYPGYKEPEVQRDSVTNAKVAQ